MNERSVARFRDVNRLHLVPGLCRSVLISFSDPPDLHSLSTAPSTLQPWAQWCRGVLSRNPGTSPCQKPCRAITPYHGTLTGLSVMTVSLKPLTIQTTCSRELDKRSTDYRYSIIVSGECALLILFMPRVHTRPCPNSYASIPSR